MNNETTANILVIDDTPANLRVLASMLEEQGYYARPVNNGTMGIQAAQLSSPDLILLDIQMPDMNGFEVCRQLKADERTHDIPVIFISALNETSDKIEAFRVGGADYITKPFQIEEVQARVEVQIELQQLRKRDKHLIEEQIQLIAELDAFSHTVAHDLKNPLSAVTGFAELLASTKYTISKKQQAEIADKIVIGADRMNSIITALLLLAKARKAEDIPTDTVEMNTVIAEVLARLDVMINEYKPEIILPKSWPESVGYMPWVEEIWANYLSNGMKYGGQPPRLEFGADKIADDMIRYWIKDNGVGMTTQEKSILFAPFARLESAQKIEGHGLGLSIVQRVATKMGGTVGAESTIGEGSLFYFTLPSTHKS